MPAPTCAPAAAALSAWIDTINENVRSATQAASLAQMLDAISANVALNLNLHTFAWSDWKPGAGGVMVSPGGRKLSRPVFERLSTKTKEQKPAPQRTRAPGTATKPPARAKQRTGAPTAPAKPAAPRTSPAGIAPAKPSAPPGFPPRGVPVGPVTAPAPTSPTAPPTAPKPGRAKRAAKAVGAGAKALGTGAKVAGKATWTVAGKLQQATAWTVEKTMAAMEALGAKIKSFGWLERQTGLGRLIEKDAGRKRRRAAAVKAAAAAGGLGAGTRAFMGESARLLGLRWKENRRKYGVVPAVLLEAAYFGVVVARKVTGVLTGLPVASIALKPLTAALGVIANASTRGLLNFIGKRTLAKREVKRNPNAPGRVAQRMDKGKMVALPGGVVSRARDIRRGAGPGDLVPTGGATTSRSKRFAEDGVEVTVPTFGPADLVAELRSMVEESLGERLDVNDGELAKILTSAVTLLPFLARPRPGV